MTWGRDTDEHEARDIVAAYYEAGGRLIDTADVYADGAAETLIGDLLHDFPEVMVSSKVGTVRGSRRRDASRAHLLTTLESSLRRLGRSYIDVWHVHAWDPHTPIDETLSAIDVAVSSGKVRYAGISNYSGWQLATAASGPTTLVSAQMEYSLLQRGIEREVIPATLAHGLGVMAWSPLGRGVLTGKYRFATPPDSRAASPAYAPFVTGYLHERPRTITDAVATAAEGLGLEPAHVALAWVLAQPQVSTAIVGARTVQQLRSVLPGAHVSVPDEILNALSEVSAPERSYPEHGWSQA
jgi:aryl-alcohol dehydrogenase-like predicted oxidoreductase